MNTHEAIRARRAVKHYDPNFVIPPEHERELFDLTRQSPTSFNMQNWRFVVVKDKAKRERIRKAAWGQAQITEASLLVVLCADTKAHAKDPARYWEGAPKPRKMHWCLTSPRFTRPSRKNSATKPCARSALPRKP